MAAEMNDELFTLICDITANSSKGIQVILKELDTSVGVFWRFKESSQERMEQYTRAKNLQLLILAGEILSISDDKSGDVLDGDLGKTGNSAAVNRAKLQTDSRKWLLSKLAPKEYGDKIEVSGTMQTTQVFKIGDTEISM
jgi:hypothetical protein